MTNKEQREPGGRFYCDCTAGDQPCGLSAPGRGKNTKGRCEGCHAGLHVGHSIKRENAA